MRSVALGLALLPCLAGAARVNFVYGDHDSNVRAWYRTEAGDHDHPARGGKVSLAEAEGRMNKKMREAISRISDDAARAQPSAAATNATPTDAEGGAAQGIMMADDDEFQEEHERLVRSSFQPNVQAYICFQVDVDISMITVPGLQLNLGLQGGVHLDWRNHCWGATFEASLGFDWGFKLLGYEVGIGASVTGSIDLAEVPPTVVSRDPDAYVDNPALYAPEGADLTYCHSKSPWIVIQAFIESEYRRIFKQREMSEAMERLMRNTNDSDRAREYLENYTRLLNGSFDVVAASGVPLAPSLPTASDIVLRDTPPEWPGVKTPAGPAPSQGSDEQQPPEVKTFVRAPSLSGPAVAMERAFTLFATRLPPYAQQVLGRLVDRGQDYTGSDNERWALGHSRSMRRFTKSKGRYLARWPSAEQFAKLTGDDVPEGLEDAGIRSNVINGDQRVVNFAKVARLSENGRSPMFWKEVATSAGNLFVRIVGDVKALFSVALAEDASWDGSCTSLPSVVRVGDTIDPELLQRYPWAGPSTNAGRLTAFARYGDKRVLRAMPPGRADPDGSHLYPHLWCTLAKHAPREHVQPPNETSQLSIAELRDAEEPLEVAFVQACETVAIEVIDLMPTDTVMWNDHENHFQVERNGTFAGFLVFKEVTVCRGCLVHGVAIHTVDTGSALWTRDALTAAAAHGYRVAMKVVETRPECERTLLPVPFLRIFPRLVSSIREYTRNMEGILLDANACLGQEHNTEKILASLGRGGGGGWQRPEECDTPRGALFFVKKAAKRMVRMVRKFLLRLGAGLPWGLARSMNLYASIPFSSVELDILKAKARFAHFVKLMASDFTHALGYEVQAEPRLTGRFWPHVHSLRDQLLHIADPLNRIMKRSAGRLRPPFESTSALSVTVQLNRNGFCTPNSGALIAQRIAHTSRRSWSPHESEEVCYIGRVRPGDFYVQIARCTGSNGGQNGDWGNYVDWRVRLQGILVKGDVLVPGESGLIGSLFSGGSIVSAAAMSSGSIAGGILGSSLVDRMAPQVVNSTVLTALLYLGASSSPLLGLVGTSMVVESVTSFRQLCLGFLQHLSRHGVVSASSSAESTWPFAFNVYAVVWGAVIHREKQVKLVNGPGKYLGQEASVVKSQKFMTYHFENWNRIDATFQIPAIGAISVYGKLELDFDLTGLVEHSRNKLLYEENRGRIRKCRRCVGRGEAFCDWKIVLGSIWVPSFDECVPATNQSTSKCERDVGFADDVGEPVTATYYSPEAGPGPCEEINFVRANREFRANDVLRRFFRRH